MVNSDSANRTEHMETSEKLTMKIAYKITCQSAELPVRLFNEMYKKHGYGLIGYRQKCEIGECILYTCVEVETSNEERKGERFMSFEQQAKSMSGIEWMKPVVEYLRKRDDIADKLDSENKSIRGCASFILSEARKQAGNKRGIVETDQYVFGLAVHYYDEDIKVDEAVDYNADVIWKEDREKEKEIVKKKKALDEKEKQLEEREKMIVEAEKRQRKIQEKRAPRKKKKEDERQMSLFDL